MSFKKSFRYIKAKLLNGDTGNTREVLIEKSDADKHSTTDPKMISFEVYNRGRNRIWFEEILLPEFGGMNRRIVCEPDGFCFLPHSYFTGYSDDGKDLNIVKNFGKMKFIGNKQAQVLQ